MTVFKAQPVLQGSLVQEDLYTSINPVRYRYVMAYLHDEMDADGKLHKAGEVMYVLPMLSVTYAIGIYAGTNMSGEIHLPTFFLDQMPHPPLNIFQRRPHPDQGGIPLGSAFECGNRAIYVMRNEKVVWGGILWSRDYNSGNPTMSITALSWDGYIYYRLLRRSIRFVAPVNQYVVWYAALKAALSDYSWKNKDDGWSGNAYADAQSIIKNKAGHITKINFTFWTGITKTRFNAEPTNYLEQWPNNSPNIELPPQSLRLYSDYPKNKTEVKQAATWRGYTMSMFGAVLEEWANTHTILTEGKPFEYRVVCWFDSSQQKFRQRYVYGEMAYASGQGPETDNPTPTGIISPLFGKNTQAMAQSIDNVLIFDFPGHISSWSLAESMDGCATRVIATDQGEDGLKHAEYAWDKYSLDRPNTGTARGSQGWLLYDSVASYEITTKIVSTLQDRATRLLGLFKVPTAQQLDDLATPSAGQRASRRSTNFQATLHTDPTTPFPDFQIGDWAAFNIEDPFYGGTMYLVRRIVGYSVTVNGDQESDYSSEDITLELTDDTQISLGE